MAERLLEISVFQPLGIEKIEEEREGETHESEMGATDIKIEGAHMFGKLKDAGPATSPHFSSEAKPGQQAEPSRLSLTLLQNYLLAISLMKNIALTFASANLEEYNQNVKDQIQKMREIENRLPPTTEFGISYLVVQHKKEVIDVHEDYHRVLKETFSAEFLNMLRMCLFVPFIHESTPLPENIPACQDGQHLPDIEEVKEFME